MNSTAVYNENVPLIVITQLIVIIGASRACGALFRRLGQPLVCGEIAAGLILGPSVLGGIFPGTFHQIFDPSVAPIFSIMSQLGLILLMFLVGLEFDFGHLSENRRTALSVSLIGVLLPFGLGLLLGQWMHAALALGGSRLNFSLFIAVAMSITAIPILGRIMIELRINRTRIGSITISAAAIDDVVGWLLLALITAMTRSALDPVEFGLMIAETLGFAMCMVWMVRPLLRKWIAHRMRKDLGALSLVALAALLILVLAAAAVTNVIGIFSIFGAFFCGAILYDQVELREALRARVRDFVTVFFLPIFFTYTGLRTDIGTLAGGGLWVMCGLVLLAAFAGKFGGCCLAARFSGLSWREAGLVGVMMNTRALMELIVINLGYDLGVIPKSVFFMLVLMAVVSTYVTAPVLRRLLPPATPSPAAPVPNFAARGRVA